MDSKADPAMALGSKRVHKVLPFLHTVVQLPSREIRTTLAISFLQGLNSATVLTPLADLDFIQTAVIHAYWGNNLTPNNTMRNVAVTSGLLIPLH